MFRNGPRRGILMICLLHILRPAERMSCARGAAWRFGNGIQRRALPGPEDCLLFSDLAGAICLLDRAAGTVSGQKFRHTTIFTPKISETHQLHYLISQPLLLSFILKLQIYNIN